MSGAAFFAAAQSALDPAGVQSSRIGDLWWVYFAITAVVYTLVLIFLLVPVFRKRQRLPSTASDPPILSPEPRVQRRLTVMVVSAVTISAATLLILAVSDFSTQRALASLASEPNAVPIKITGRQWWWQVEYPGAAPSNMVTTANEIHIPVGRPIQLQLQSADVIHSFWVPNLHGKKDLVTGHPTTNWMRADRAGTFYGQCAEFCGHQHARMRLIVVAEPQQQFDAWLSAQRKPAPMPSTDSQKRGFATFMSSTCVMCHSIDGTPASGMTGPNLTHIASRQRIAANFYPNTREYLRSWIQDPQHLKPGVFMPQHHFSADELNNLLDYLETLK